MARLRTLPDALSEAARAGTGYTFVSGRTETFRAYADVRLAALQVAGALRAVGLCRGDLVAIVLPDADQFLTTLLGASIAEYAQGNIQNHPPDRDRAEEARACRFLPRRPPAGGGLPLDSLRGAPHRATGVYVNAGAWAPRGGAFGTAPADRAELSLNL